MNIESLFIPACVSVGLNTVSKKQLLQEMAEMAVSCGACAHTNLKTRDVVSAVMERERLGSTGVGHGVAIPHARLEGLDQVRAVFARLETPLDYESIDDRPVDLVVLLLAPANAGGDHLRALAQISRLLRKEDMRARLRSAPNAESLHLLLTEKRVAGVA
ncbi:MAG: transcriptional regulator [Robiginitomaculum sp.]|nr:MAG: transcriptional regulator [Robiginitomaculum sp.]